MADHRVELEPGEPERAVAEQQADLAVGARELRRDRVARARSEAAVGPGVHPAAGLVGLDHPARIGDEVAAVADHDRSSGRSPAGARCRGASDGAARGRPRARPARRRASRPRPRGARPASRCGPGRRPRPRAARRAWPRRRRRARTRPRAGADARAAPGRSRRSSSRRRTSRRSRAGSPSARRSTSATSAPFSAAQRAREKNDGWSAGHAAAREAVQEHRDLQLVAERLERLLAARPVEAGAGHDRRALGAAQQLDRLLDAVGGGQRQRIGKLAGRGRRLALHEDVVEREVDERRARAAARAWSAAPRRRARRSRPSSRPCARTSSAARRTARDRSPGASPGPSASPARGRRARATASCS